MAGYNKIFAYLLIKEVAEKFLTRKKSCHIGHQPVSDHLHQLLWFCGLLPVVRDGRERGLCKENNTINISL